MRRHYYQAYPVNYMLLHEEEQESVVEAFKSLLNQVRRDLIITCRREVKEIRWEDRVFEADLYSFYIESLERLDEYLDAAGLLYQPLLNPPPRLLDLRHVIVKSRYIISEGRVYRVLAAYRLPATLTEGFIQEILPLVDEARIYIKPIHRHYAVRMLQRRYRFLRALMSSYQYEGRPPDLRVDLHCDLWRGSLQFGAGQFTVGDLVAYLKGGVDDGGPLRIEKRIRRRKNKMSVEDLLNLFQAHVDVAGSIAKLHREIAEVKAGLKRVIVETVFNKQPLVCRLSDEEYKKIIDAAWRGLGPGLRQQLRQLWEAGLYNVIEPLYKQAVRQCGEIIIKEIIPELIKALKENRLVLDKTVELEGYKKHPGWKKLEELREHGIVALGRGGILYYGPDLWNYIKSKTRSGALRGLNSQLLRHIRDYYGDVAVRLLLAMQENGGKISIWKALEIITDHR